MNNKLPGSLSVVMPVFNEQDVVGSVVRDFAKVLDRFEKPEFVIVNDKSTDKTAEVLESLKKEFPFLRVLNQSVNRGHGPSLTIAFRESTGDFVFHCDGDNQFVADDFWLLWKKLQEENLDAAVGYRGERHDPLARLVLTRFLRLFLFLTLRSRLPDSNCPFRVYRRASLDRILKLLPVSPIIPSILMIAAAYRLSMKVGWVNVRHLPRLTGHSFIRSWKIFRICLTAVNEVLDFLKRLNAAQDEK